MNLNYREQEAHRIATAHGWVLEQYQRAIGLLIFVKDEMQVNVYATTMTVGTALKHPKKGATQLFRRNVTFDQLRKIFAYPRVHTGKGYFERSELERRR